MRISHDFVAPTRHAGRDYGVRDDGTDQTVRLQAAIDGCGDRHLSFEGMGRIRFSGTVYVDDARATNGTRVARRMSGSTAPLGPAQSYTARKLMPSLVYTGSGGVALDAKGQGFNVSGVHFEEENASDAATLLKMYRTDGFEDIDAYIHNCAFRGGAKAIHSTGRGLDVQECTFETLNVGIDLDFPASIDASADLIQQADTAFRGITIRDNRFHSIDLAAIQNTGAQAPALANLQVVGNHMDGLSYRFFDGHASGAVFAGNQVTQIKAGGAALRLTSCLGATITGNRFAGIGGALAAETDWPNYLIDFSGVAYQVKIIGNIFENALLRALNFSQDADYVSIIGNGFRNGSGWTNGTKPVIYFVNAGADDISIIGNSFDQKTGTTYAANLIQFLAATPARLRLIGNLYNESRHGLCNVPASHRIDAPMAVATSAAAFVPNRAVPIRVGETTVYFAAMDAPW